ncbi:glutamate receptor U1-like [Centruroides vittatus]|uniref:glutamate receptor U1-like n=1 Tax=Centruroides vittatus TaxID=120091 RepID=UPI00350EEF86
MDKEEKQIINGIYFDIFKIIQEKSNSKYKLISPVDNVFGTKNQNGSWNGMVGQISRKEADFGFVPLYVTAERLKYIDFSTPLKFPQIKFLIKAPKERSSFDSIVRPFTFQTWLTIILSTFIFGLILYEVIRLDSDFTENKQNWSIMKVYWFLFGTFTCKGENLNSINGFSAKCIIGIWWLSVVVLVSSYSGTLKSSLAYPHFERVPTTFHKLAIAIRRKEYSCGIMHGSAITDYILKSRSGVARILADDIRSNNNFINEHNEILSRIMNSRFAFIDSLPYFENLIKYENYDQEKFLLSEDSLVTFSEAYGLKKNFSYKAKINVIISRLHAAGIVNKENYFQNNNLEDIQASDARSLIIEDLMSPFILLILGYVLSIICFILELFISKL